MCCGNVLLKATEGTAMELLIKLKKDIYSSWVYKLGAAIMAKMFKAEKDFFNYQNYGGSVLLGTSKVVIKGHGSSRKEAVVKCLEQAWRIQSSELNAKTEAVICKYEHYEL